jgi:hypothetical protein
MTDDEVKALRWLLGRGVHTEAVRTEDGRRVTQHIGEIGARDALIRLLRSPLLLNPAIRDALASAIEQRGSSDMMLELNLVRRKRGRPAGDVALSVKKQKLNAATEAKKKEGAKTYLAVEFAAKECGVSLSTMKTARKAGRRAKAVRDDEN